MQRRDLRLTTNVEDLLDDGIENNSDLVDGELLREPEGNPDPRALEIRAATIARNRAEEALALNQFRRKNLSYLGILLALVLAISGIALILRPMEIRVEHARMKYLPTVTEHVTAARSRLYGSVLLVAGIVLLAYSLQRPRS